LGGGLGVDGGGEGVALVLAVLVEDGAGALHEWGLGRGIAFGISLNQRCHFLS
jgi:hypothetical protein